MCRFPDSEGFCLGNLAVGFSARPGQDLAELENECVDAGDIPLGSRAVPTLASGASNAGATLVTIPAGTATGTYNILAEADGAHVLAERNESNNLSSRILRVGPDLTAAVRGITGTLGAGATISVQDLTSNPSASAELYLRLVPGRFVRPLSSLQALQTENAQVEASIYVTPNRHLHPAGSRFRSPNVAKSPCFVRGSVSLVVGHVQPSHIPARIKLFC